MHLIPVGDSVARTLRRSKVDGRSNCGWPPCSKCWSVSMLFAARARISAIRQVQRLMREA